MKRVKPVMKNYSLITLSSKLKDQSNINKPRALSFGISTSLNGILPIRAADVSLKERRKTALVVRETPLHLGHLKLMERVTEMGAIVFPPIPAFYHQPKRIEDIINHSIGKIFNQFGIRHHLFKRWGEPEV